MTVAIAHAYAYAYAGDDDDEDDVVEQTIGSTATSIVAERS
jgi:hypothetical protein